MKKASRENFVATIVAKLGGTHTVINWPIDRHGRRSFAPVAAKILSVISVVRLVFVHTNVTFYGGFHYDT
jgi:hypothetical protein